MDKKRDWLEFILTSFGVAFHGGLFRDIHFIGPLELVTIDSPKPIYASAL